MPPQSKKSRMRGAHVEHNVSRFDALFLAHPVIQSAVRDLSDEEHDLYVYRYIADPAPVRDTVENLMKWGQGPGVASLITEHLHDAVVWARHALLAVHDRSRYDSEERSVIVKTFSESLSALHERRQDVEEALANHTYPATAMDIERRAVNSRGEDILLSADIYQRNYVIHHPDFNGLEFFFTPDLTCTACEAKNVTCIWEVQGRRCQKCKNSGTGCKVYSHAEEIAVLELCKQLKQSNNVELPSYTRQLPKSSAVVDTDPPGAMTQELGDLIARIGMLTDHTEKMMSDTEQQMKELTSSVQGSGKLMAIIAMTDLLPFHPSLPDIASTLERAVFMATGKSMDEM